MQNIRCEKDCVHQRDGWCSLETGIKSNRNADNCAYITEQIKSKNKEPSKANTEEEKYF